MKKTKSIKKSATGKTSPRSIYNRQLVANWLLYLLRHRRNFAYTFGALVTEYAEIPTLVVESLVQLIDEEKIKFGKVASTKSQPGWNYIFHVFNPDRRLNLYIGPDEIRNHRKYDQHARKVIRTITNKK